MKAATAIVFLLLFSTVASAQNPDPNKWMCRNLSESGGFVYQGETIFGSQACRAITQAAVQSTPTSAPTPASASQPQQPAVQVMPVASAVAGRPQVTTFKHQTLGESWDDFMRITGAKLSPCTSDKPELALWCETFKKIDAGENATLTDNTPVASVSLVFSERKLVQVLAVGKADWAKSIAEFTQLYGAPDTQTASSAAWSFADGGGISVSDSSGNLFRATFYSKDGKPKDQDTPAAGAQPEPVQSATSSAVGSQAPAQSEYLSAAELEGATRGGGKGVTITAGSPMGQAFAASLANVNLAQYASIQLFTRESWIAFSAQLAHRQYQQFNPATLPQEETLRGLIVVALGGAYGSNAGPQCNSVTRIALISDKGGAVVAEPIDQESASSSWGNAFGATASCNALVAKFAEADVQRVSSAAQKGEYFVGVFSGSNLLFMYKVKEKFLKELGR
jgi:hypothetical protein